MESSPQFKFGEDIKNKLVLFFEQGVECRIVSLLHDSNSGRMVSHEKKKIFYMIQN